MKLNLVLPGGACTSRTLICVAIAFIYSLLITSCKKGDAPARHTSTPAFIQSAQSYFNETINVGNEVFDQDNFRGRQSKMPIWNQAKLVSLSVGQAIVIPIQYRKRLYLKTPICGTKLLDLSQLTKLLIYLDSNGHFHYQVNTFIPDSNALLNPARFSGIVFTEDWFGHSLLRAAVLAPKASSDKIPDVVQTVQACTTVYGYNYSPDDPDDGYAWSETTCTTYGFVTGVGVGGGPVGTIPAAGGTSATFIIPAPTNIIGNYPDYMKCFTNVGGSDHTYTITVAVEQPQPGTRTPWIPNSQGGSSSPLNVGHTWLILSEKTGNGTTTRNVGFYPQGIITPLYPSDQGVLNDNEGTPYNVCLNITATNAQFFTVLNFLAQGNNPGYIYNLNTNNCTTFALNALASSGINVPTTKGSWLEGGGYDPGDLGEDIRSMQLPANMTRNTVSNPHPNVGTCY